MKTSALFPSDLLFRWLLTLVASLLIAQAAEESTEPTIKEVQPANGAENVPVDTPVAITFSKAMDTAYMQIQFINALEFPPRLLTMSASWSADATRITCTPAEPYAANAQIEWNILQARDQEGQSLSGVRTGKFSTGLLAPEITEVQPATGTENVLLNTPVAITFSKPMNTAMTQIQFVNVLEFPPRMLPMTSSWSTDATRMICTPAQPYPANAQIQWQFLLAQDLNGQSLAGVRAGMFFTGQTSGAQPELLSANPPNQATNVAQNATFTFTFNLAMVKVATKARFFEMERFTNVFLVSNNWDVDGKVLTCTPSANFPPGMVVGWRIEGVGAEGGIFPGAGGGFTTAGTASNKLITAVISLGEAVRQADTNLFEIEGQEYAAMASVRPETQLDVATPGGKTNVLSIRPGLAVMEYSTIEENAPVFSTNYLPGAYQFLIRQGGSNSAVAVHAGDGALPVAPRFAWKPEPHVVLDQPLIIAWDIPGGVPMDYLRLRVADGGNVLFITPLPGEAGALTGASNAVVVPGSAFTKAGRAEVSLAAFRFTATNSAADASVRAARHRSTVFELRMVDGNEPPPSLVSTNIPGLPFDEPLLMPLRSNNGVRALRYRVASGELPPGVTLEPTGILTGSATSEGVYQSTVEVTDLLGRSGTQTVRLGTVPLPVGSIPPRLENPSITSESFSVELVDPTASQAALEDSADLVQWTPCYTNAAGSKWAKVTLAAAGQTRFVRARAAQNYPARRPVNPLTVNPVVNAEVSASGVFEEWGGKLSLTNGSGHVFTLIIPPGALERTETITMREITQVGGLPLSGGLIAAVDLQPEGLLFNRMVRLDITPPTAVELRTLVGFNAENGGTRFGLQPSFLTNNTISLHLQHLTMAGAGSGTSQDASAQGERPPDEGGKRTDQEAAEEMARCRMDPNCDVNSEQEKARLREIFVRQADQVIIPRLREAVANESAIESAIIGWLGWLRQMAQTCYDGDSFNPQGSGALENRMQLAQNLAGRALLNGIQKNCQLCMSGDAERIARVTTFSFWAANLGFDPGNEPFNCIDQCLKFEVWIDPLIRSTDGGREVEIQTSAKVKLTRVNAGAATDVLSFNGSAEWKVDSANELKIREDCKMNAAPTSGTVEVARMRLSLYRKESVGELVRYIWDPQVKLYLKADRGQMPKEDWRIICGPVGWVVGEIFAPAFLALHDSEILRPEAGSFEEEVLGGPAVVISDLNPGLPPILATKFTFTEQPLANGGMLMEYFHPMVVHKP